MMELSVKTVDYLILKRYGYTALFLFMLFLVIAVVMVLFDSLEELMDAGAPLELGMLYVLLRVPHEILKAAPMVAVLAMAITVGDMMRFHEMTMLLIAGYSPLRLLAPLAVVLLIAVGALFFTYENVAGPASTFAHNLMETQIKSGGAGINLRGGIWIHGENNRIYYAETYMPHQMELRGFTMFVFQGPNHTISERFDAESAVWQPSTGLWFLKHITARKIYADGSIDRHMRDEDYYDLERTPSDFERVTMEEELMPHGELKRMVEMLKSAGEDPGYYLAGMRIKEAFPFAIFFLGILTFCLTLNTGSSGRASGIGTGLLLVIGYYVALSLGKSLSNAGVLTPVVGAWYPNVIAFGATVYIYWQLRKVT